MLKKLSSKIAIWLIKSDMLKDDNIDLYSYAIQYLLLIIIPTINFTVYCIATHKIYIGLIEIFSFLLTRKFCGGYHCESSSVCLIFSTILLIFIAWISCFIKPGLYIIIPTILADLELILRGPVISINHSVSDIEKKYYHKRLITIIIFLNFLIILTSLLKLFHICNCICIVLLCCSVSHIVCKFGKNKELYY